MKQTELQMKTQNTPIKELLKEQVPELSTGEATEIVARKPIENSPFWIIREEGVFFAVMGKNRITPTFNTEEELIIYMDKNTWEIIFHMTCIISETLINEKFQNQNQ